MRTQSHHPCVSSQVRVHSADLQSISSTIRCVAHTISLACSVEPYIGVLLSSLIACCGLSIQIRRDLDADIAGMRFVSRDVRCVALKIDCKLQWRCFNV